MTVFNTRNLVCGLATIGLLSAAACSVMSPEERDNKIAALEKQKILKENPAPTADEARESLDEAVEAIDQARLAAQGVEVEEVELNESQEAVVQALTALEAAHVVGSLAELVKERTCAENQSCEQPVVAQEPVDAADVEKCQFPFDIEFEVPAKDSANKTVVKMTATLKCDLEIDGKTGSQEAKDKSEVEFSNIEAQLIIVDPAPVPQEETE